MKTDKLEDVVNYLLSEIKECDDAHAVLDYSQAVLNLVSSLNSIEYRVQDKR